LRLAANFERVTHRVDRIEQRLLFVEIGAVKRIAEGNDPSRFSAAVANLKFHRRHRLRLLPASTAAARS
jgi:hypothetical protein